MVLTHRGITLVLKMLQHQQISNESLSLTGEFKEGLRKAKRAKAEEERKDYYALLQVSLSLMFCSRSLSLQSLSFFGDSKLGVVLVFAQKPMLLFEIRWKRRPRWKRSRKLTEKRR